MPVVGCQVLFNSVGCQVLFNSVGCQVLFNSVGSQNAVVLMLRKLLLLEGS